FGFRFDDDELIHIRHGDRASVIMGGDPWSSGSHLEAPNLAMTQVQGHSPVEFLIRSQTYFDLMEPVIVELRLRNLMPDVAVAIDKRLAPEFGGVVIYIQGPDRKVVQYDPVMCAVGTPEILLLKPAGGEQGEDRYSREIFLTYGNGEFYFDHPGEYRIRGVYQGCGDMLIPSNTHRIRIGMPDNKQADRLTQDYFSDEVGMALYLQGSRSPFLQKGTQVLEDLAGRFKNTLMGAKVAVALANGVAQPFFRIIDPDKPKPKVAQTAAADPNKALELTDPALKVIKAHRDKTLNLAYGRIVRRRAQYLAAAGAPARAKTELKALREDLAKRGANAPVLAQYQALEQALPASTGRYRQLRGTSTTDRR